MRGSVLQDSRQLLLVSRFLLLAVQPQVLQLSMQRCHLSCSIQLA
jgi:hypothetical protein